MDVSPPPPTSAQSAIHHLEAQMEIYSLMLKLPDEFAALHDKYRPLLRSTLLSYFDLFRQVGEAGGTWKAFPKLPFYMSQVVGERRLWSV